MIDAATLKQIAGRAGRYRTAAQAGGEAKNLDEDLPDSTTSSPRDADTNLGLATTLEGADLPTLRKAMQGDLDPIMSAGIFPPTNILTKFAAYFPPSTNFSYVLLRLHELSLKHPRYHLCELRDQTSIADTIQPIENLTTHDRMIFCAAPASLRGPSSIRSILQAFAKCVGERSSGALLDIDILPLDVLDEEMRVDRDYMLRLETLHKALILYLWLSYRFAGVFINQEMGFYVKKIVEEKIDKALKEYSSSPEIRDRIRKMREQALRQISELNSPMEESSGSLPQAETADVSLASGDRDVSGQNAGSESLQIEEQLQRIGNEIEEGRGIIPP